MEAFVYRSHSPSSFLSFPLSHPSSIAPFLSLTESLRSSHRARASYSPRTLLMAAGSIRVTMEVGADGVALITIANPPVNALHPISKQRADASLLPRCSIMP